MDIIHQAAALAGTIFAAYVAGAMTGPTVWKRIKKAWFG